jgi:hypothetical protein
MRDDVIRGEYPMNDSDASYLVQVAARLDPLFPGGIVDVSAGMALFYALQVVSLSFEDGLRVNDIGDDNTTIGPREAALVLASLDAKGRSPEWWTSQRFEAHATEDDRRKYDDVMSGLGRLPGVARMDRP